MVLVKLDEYVGTGDDDAMLGGASGDEFDIADNVPDNKVLTIKQSHASKVCKSGR